MMACSLHAPSELRGWVQCLFSVAICLRPWVAVCLSVLSSLLLLQRVRTGFVERLQDYAEESGKSRKSGCLPNYSSGPISGTSGGHLEGFCETPLLKPKSLGELGESGSQIASLTGCSETQHDGVAQYQTPSRCR